MRGGTEASEPLAALQSGAPNRENAGSGERDVLGRSRPLALAMRLHSPTSPSDRSCEAFTTVHPGRGYTVPLGRYTVPLGRGYTGILVQASRTVDKFVGHNRIVCVLVQTVCFAI
jgi:hypothetical protein